MADRYWVGGTAAWDGTAGTKWAATSGGPGGETVPTTADDVYFDASSTGTCTISTGNTGAKSINCTGFTGTITGTAAITVAGSVTLDAGQTYTHTGTVTFTGTGTLTTAGKTFSGVFINTAGVIITLGDALNTANRVISIRSGNFDTANYTVTTQSLSAQASTARTISLGSSTVNLVTGFLFETPSTLTFDAGTSQINITNSSGNSDGAGKTFYNLSYTSVFNVIHTLSGANTFNDLSVTAPSSAGVAQLSIAANQTINGTLSTTGTAGNCRVWFRSDTYGVRRTLTVNSAPSLTDADFRDIIVNGTSAPISGTRIGNRGACAGITFDAPKTVYLNSASNTTWENNVWAATSGGSSNTDNFPLPQDTAVIENASIPTSSVVSITSSTPFISTIDMSARTNAVTVAFNSTSTCYGSWTNGSGSAFSSGSAVTFSGEGTKTITSAGKTFTCPITVDAYGGTVELADALNIGSQNLTVTNGTFDTQSYNVTAGSFISVNSNVRTINLGSSTITLIQAQGWTFTTSTNATLNSGTSQINSSATNPGFAGGGLTYYNVSMTSTSVGQSDITGANTFNNLTITAPASAGLTQCTFAANQTVNGTLTCAGATAVRRIFLRSSILGTPRTLTVGTLSANDCDFRDITIAGTAAGGSPTRAGDCGGNSGITFPAAKTVYWNLAGTQNWSADGWATSSGGVPATNNFPLAQDTAVFDDAGSAGTVTIDQSWNIGTLDASARTAAMTLSGNTNYSLYGSWAFGSGVTLSGTGTKTFFGRGTSTITSSGKTWSGGLTVDCATGTVQLLDALQLGSTSVLRLDSGTFDTSNYNVTARSFNSNTARPRTLYMGSGTWTIIGGSVGGTIWDINSTALSFFKDTADILIFDTSTNARTFNGAALSYNKLTIGGATGTSTLTITGNNQFTELASDKTVAHTIALGTTTQTFGKWSVTGTSGNVVTLTGTGTSHVLAGACTSGIDYLAMGSIGFAATSPGEFYAGANSTGTAGAPVYRTAKPADSTRYWVGGTGNWSDTARWSDASGGSSGFSVPRSHDDVVFDSSSNATAYTATVNAVTGGIRCKSLTIAGPASGNLTLAGSTAIVGIHGNVTFPATGLTRTYTGAMTLSSNSTGLTFTTNGVTLASAITVNGVDCGWSLGSALNIGTANFTVTNGSFDTANYNLTCEGFNSNNSNTRTITFGSSTITIGSNNYIVIATNLTFNAGTSQININAANPTFQGQSQTFYNVSFTGTSAGTRSITGANTFNNLTLNASATGLTQLSIAADQTVSGTFTCAGSSAVARGFVRSNTIGTTRTITAAVISANDCDFRDITIAGAASPISPTRAGDCGGNTNITFPAAKTVYRVGTNTTWVGSSSWATTSGGAGSDDNFPLAQDTAVIDQNTTLTGTLGGNVVYNVGSLDASTRTTVITLNIGGAQYTYYGSFALGSGVTITGANDLTFSGRGTMTFTSAGKTITFPITVNTPSGTFQLGDAFVSDNASSSPAGITLDQGTFDAVSYNVTAGRVQSVTNNTRTFLMGSGLWTITLAGTGVSAPWNFSGSNLTFDAETADILFTDTSSTTKQLNLFGLTYNKITIGGATGTSTTTISGNNTFSEIASTKTVAHTIALGTTTQRVGAWTVTGTSGNVVTITGDTSNLIYTSAGSLSGIDYLNIQGRAYGPNGETSGVWLGGTNSVNSGSLGWEFIAGTPPSPTATGNMFFMFN